MTPIRILYYVWTDTMDAYMGIPWVWLLKLTKYFRRRPSLLAVLEDC
jgi:hypothetical protein